MSPGPRPRTRPSRRWRLKYAGQRADTTTVEWLQALAIAVLCLALAWLPGLAVARAWRAPQGAVATLAVAPALMYAVAGRALWSPRRWASAGTCCPWPWRPSSLAVLLLCSFDDVLARARNVRTRPGAPAR